MQSLCGAKTRTGGTCKGRPMRNGRCRMHGGTALIGAAAPGFRHGRYTSMPTRLVESFEAARSDGELLALRDDIAITDARLSDLIGRVDSGESGALWRDLGEAQGRMDEARRAKDAIGIGAAADEIRMLITRGHSDYAAWGEIRALVDHRRKLVDSEAKRLVQMQQSLRADQALALVSAVLDAVQREVKDRKTLSRISNAALALLNAGGPKS